MEKNYQNSHLQGTKSMKYFSGSFLLTRKLTKKGCWVTYPKSCNWQVTELGETGGQSSQACCLWPWAVSSSTYMIK